MGITVRKRGAIWHARGTVRVGKASIYVPSFSTGCGAHADALAVAAAEEARIRAEHLEGPAGRARALTIGDCFEASLRRPGGLPTYEIARIAALNEAMGNRLVSEAPGAWRDWTEARPRLAISTLARSRNTLAAALRLGTAAIGGTAPPLPALPHDRRGNRLVILTPAERAALLRSYNPSAAAPVLLLADQGLRTQEALRLDWRHVDCEGEELRLPAGETKSGRGRAIPMTRRVALLLWGLWEGAGRPQAGPVFLSARGIPYADTRGRGDSQQGGNPLAQAHITACRKAGVLGFRVHDWRHDWAARQIMGGMDLFTLCRLGGWRSLKMVEERYGAVSARHLRDAVRRIA